MPVSMKNGTLCSLLFHLHEQSLPTFEPHVNVSEGSAASVFIHIERLGGTQRLQMNMKEEDGRR